MKQSVFIVMLLLIAYSSCAQSSVDSTARVRKPVLLYLLEQNQKAILLSAEVRKIPLLEKENSLLRQGLAQAKKDSSYLAASLATADASAEGWRNTAEKIEKTYDHELKKQKLLKWLGFGLAAVIGITAVRAD